MQRSSLWSLLLACGGLAVGMAAAQDYPNTARARKRPRRPTSATAPAMRGMIFGVAQYVSRMSRYLTLHPDDVIWFGCDGPTVPALQPGDLVEVVNDAIGVLANRVVRGR